MIKTVSFPNSLFPTEKEISVRKGKEVLKFLATIEGLYALAAEALTNLHDPERLDLRAFDPLSTTCTCHIHALIAANLGSKILAKSKFFDTLKESLELIRRKQEQTQALYASLQGLDSSEKLAEFKNRVGALGLQVKACEVLQKLDLVAELSAKVHCLIVMYLLTIIKENKKITAADGLLFADSQTPITERDRVFREVTNSKELIDRVRNLVGKEINLSLLEREVCAMAKTCLIQESLKFILKISFDSASLQNFHFIEKSVKLVQGKPEVPDFYTLTTGFQWALYEKFPVILLFRKYRRLGHAFKQVDADAPIEAGMFLVPKNGAHFEPARTNFLVGKRVVLVVIAKKNGDNPHDYVKKLMSNFDFLHLCKLDGAQHKQYTDSAMHESPSSAIPLLQEEKYSGEAKKLEDLRREALDKGFAIHSHNATLIISHIFADTLDRYQTPEFKPFFDVSAQCFEEQQQAFASDQRLAYQFMAADQRKELLRSHDRTISVPNLIAFEKGLPETDESEFDGAERLHESTPPAIRSKCSSYPTLATADDKNLFSLSFVENI